jgi:hypothetical protein
MRRTLEEELRKALEITEEALRRANGEIESLALANQTLAASDRAHMTKIEQLQREVDLYTDILRSICGLLELPHSESGPCDGVGYYTRAIEGLQVDLAKTEAERVEHSQARYKAEAETERWHRIAMDAGVIVHVGGHTSHPMRRDLADARAEIERLKGVIREAKYFADDDFPDGVDGPCIVTKRYREYYRSILVALGESEANHPRTEGNH